MAAQPPDPAPRRPHPSPAAPVPRRPVWRRNPLRRPAPADDWEQDLHRRHPPPPVSPPEHTPNYSHNPPPVDSLMLHYRRLMMLESCQPEFDRFAFLPAAGWSLFTILGCLWNGYFFSAVVVLAAIGTFAAMVFATKGSLRWQNVAIGLTACLFGIILMGVLADGAGVYNLGRVLGWLISLFPHSHREGYYGDSYTTYSAPTPDPLPNWYDFGLTIPMLAMIGLSVYCGFILYQYLGMYREICQLRDRLKEEVDG